MDESLYEVKFATFGNEEVLNNLVRLFVCNCENTITIISNGEVFNIDMENSSVEKLED